MPTHYAGDEKETRALSAYINLVRASESVVARTHARLASSGLTVTQFGVLEALLHLGPLCQNELAAKLLKSGGNITFVLDNLEKHGLAERRRGGEDRRKAVVHLTAKGRALIARLFKAHAKAVAGEFAVLSKGEQDELRRLCRCLGCGRGS